MRTASTRHFDVPGHPRFAGFEAFARREIFPWLAEKETERRATVRRFRAVIAITVAVVALLQVLAFAVFEAHPAVAVIAFGAVPAFLGGGLAWMLLYMLRAKMKQFLLPKVCGQLKLRYTGASAEFPFAAFLATGMLPRHDRHSLEDGIESDEAGVLFHAAEARLSVRKTTKNGTGSYSVIWRGLLLAARPPRPFKGLTLVMPERSFMGRLFESRPAERIELGLGELEEDLEIRSTFPEEARMFLTERVMRRLAELARRLGPERPSLALMGEHVLLAIRTNKDRFEGGSLWRPMDDPARIEALLLELGHLFDVTAALGDALRLERARPDGSKAET